MRAAAERCIGIGAVPQDRPVASCARRTWPPATRSTPPAAGPTRCVMALSAPDPHGGARRRAPARDPRPVPGVQGLQARVPARRSTWPPSRPSSWPPPRPPRRTAAGPAVRGRPAAERAGLGAGAAVQPGGALAAGAGCCERALGLAAAGHCRASSATTWCAGWPRHQPPDGPFTRGEVVFLADSFTTYTEPAIGRSRRSSCWRRLAGGSASSWRPAAAGPASPRGCWTSAGELAARMSAGWRRSPSAACRSSA